MCWEHFIWEEITRYFAGRAAIIFLEEGIIFMQEGIIFSEEGIVLSGRGIIFVR